MIDSHDGGIIVVADQVSEDMRYIHLKAVYSFSSTNLLWRPATLGLLSHDIHLQASGTCGDLTTQEAVSCLDFAPVAP